MARALHNPKSSPPVTATLESGQLLFSLTEVAGLLGISKSTLNHVVLNTGKLRRMTIGHAVRVHRNDIIKYMDELAAGAK